MRVSMRSLGVTLIELLLVIAIFAILVAIILPVTGLVKENARRGRCMSNLKQLGMASLMYIHDNVYGPPYSNCWPGPEWDSQVTKSAGDPAPDKLFAALKPYVKNQDVWFCPDDIYAHKDVIKWKVVHLYSSYKFYFLKDAQLKDDGYRLTTLMGRTIYWPASRWTLITDAYGSIPDHLIIPGQPFLGGSHPNGINIFYLDGHLRWRNWD